jgi:hypothetical protein
MYGIMAVGLTSSQMLAAVMATIFYSLWNLFSGFLIPFPVSTKKWQDHSLSSHYKKVPINISFP